MASAAIQFNAVTGNVSDYYSALGNTISLSNVDDTGVMIWAWSIEGKPYGSTAVLSDAAAAAPTFVADKVGSYLISLTVNGTSEDRKIYAILSDNTLIRIPAENEIDESGTDGWSGEADEPLILTGFAGCRGSCIIAKNNTGGVLSRGDAVVALVTDVTTKQISIAAKANPSYFTQYGQAVVFLVVSAMDGGDSIADGETLILLQDGILAGVTISGTIGADGSFNVSLGETDGEISHGTFCAIGYASAQDAIFFTPRTVAFGRSRIEYNTVEYPVLSESTTERKSFGKCIHWDLGGSDKGLKLPIVGADDMGATIQITPSGSEDNVLAITPYDNVGVAANVATGVNTAFVTLLKAGLHDEFKTSMAPGWTVNVSGQSRTVLTIEESDAAGAAGTTHWKVTPSVAFSPAPTLSDPVVLQSFSIVGNNTATRDDAHVVRGGDSVTLMLWGDSTSSTTRKWVAIARDQQNYDDAITYYDKISAVKAHSLAYNRPISRPDLTGGATYDLRRTDLTAIVECDLTTGNKELTLPPVRHGSTAGISDEGKSIKIKARGPVGSYLTVTPYHPELTVVQTGADWFTCLKADMAHPDMEVDVDGNGWVLYYIAGNDTYHSGAVFEESDAAGAAGTTHWKITLAEGSWAYGPAPSVGEVVWAFNLYMDEYGADLGVLLRGGPVNSGFGESAEFTVSFGDLIPLNEDHFWIVSELSQIPDVVRSGTPIGSQDPLHIGQRCFDTASGLLYVANGLTDTDWTLV